MNAASTEVRITEARVYDKSYSGGSRHIAYRGTREALIEFGVASPEMFEDLPKCGKKNRQADNYTLERMGGGTYRVTIEYSLDEAPPCPEGEHFTTASFYSLGHHNPDKTRVPASVHCALSGEIETRHYDDENGARTVYVGTRWQLICAGLATPSMFPPKGTASRTRKWSPEEQGDWRLERWHYSDGEQKLWRLEYRHEKYEVTPEIQKAKALMAKYELLKRALGKGDDDGEPADIF